MSTPTANDSSSAVGRDSRAAFGGLSVPFGRALDSVDASQFGHQFGVEFCRERGRVPDRDFAIMLSEWSIPMGSARPNPLEMNDFNVLTMNSKAFPGTDPLVVREGDYVRVRFGNLSGIDNHPIHLHGHAFEVLSIDGTPPAARRVEDTIDVPIHGVARLLLVADNPGTWMMHCHILPHADGGMMTLLDVGP